MRLREQHDAQELSRSLFTEAVLEFTTKQLLSIAPSPFFEGNSAVEQPRLAFQDGQVMLQFQRPAARLDSLMRGDNLVLAKHFNAIVKPAHDDR